MMNPIKVLIFGTDDIFPKLKPYYDKQVEEGNMEIVGYATFNFRNDSINFYETLDGKPFQPDTQFNKIIISSRNRFFVYLELVKSFYSNGGGGHVTYPLIMF